MYITWIVLLMPLVNTQSYSFSVLYTSLSRNAIFQNHFAKEAARSESLYKIGVVGGFVAPTKVLLKDGDVT